MARRRGRRSDPERVEQLSLDEVGKELRSGTPGRRLEPDARSGGRAMNNSSDGPAQSERKDFNDGANALWSLYGKEAQAHDEALFQGILAEMDGVPTFAGLFAGVITSFLVDSLKDLQPDPAQQSVYYQQQSVAMLAQISQQIASIAPQVSIPSIPPPPYPAFKTSGTVLLVNNVWLLGLVFSLSAALLATFIQGRVRSYMEALQEYDHPLKRARFRQFFFQGTWLTRSTARIVPLLIRFSLLLFFIGLSVSVINSKAALGAPMTFVICLYGSLSLYNTFGPLWNPRLLYQTPSPDLLALLIRSLVLSCFGGSSPDEERDRLKTDQERLVMEEPQGRKVRDVRAIQWLINRTAANADIEPLMLAIPGSFNTEWGQDVWRKVSSQAHNTSEPPTGPSPAGSQVSLTPHSPQSLEGATIDTMSRSVRYLFETCNNHSYFENEEARCRRIRVCVETTVSLVCCVGYRLDLFGDVTKLVSEIGQIDKVNQSLTTTSDTSFILRWTCLSLMDIQRTLGRNRLQVLARTAVIGLARFQSEHGQPDEAGRVGAHRIDKSLKTAWECVEDLRRAFEPWTQKRTGEQVKQILLTHEQQISDLERIKSEADGIEDVDRHISLYQDAMDDATHKLMRQLPGVSLDEPHRSESFFIRDTFNTPTTGIAPVTPQLILPGQQLRALAELGLQLREVLRGQVEGYDEVLENLKSVDRVPISLRRPDDLMKRQLWRLQDVRDGGDESNSVFYTGTFKVITSHWEESRQSLGTHCILLNIICDLIIPGRGTLSDFSCPESITAILLDTAGKIVRGYTGRDEHIREAVWEIESANLDEDIRDGVQGDGEPIQIDRRELQRRVLEAFSRFRSNPEHPEPVVPVFVS
ncbi:hypothetical protein H4582DRAFT_2102981 [Lactarius indigo]|nr:hypothetical protein H4582DRAFT_2102981 [Lactarius indigo]